MRIRDVSLQFWGREYFEKVTPTMGTIISVDEDTLLWHNLVYA